MVGTASVLVAAAGGCWWAVSASAAAPAPVIGPALVVTPAGGATTLPATPVVPVPGLVPPPVTATEGGESPEVVDPRWARPVDDDDRSESARVDGD